jgi:hypothetical protein
LLEKSKKSKESNGSRVTSLRSLLNEPEVYADNIYYYKGLLSRPDYIIKLIEQSVSESDLISAWLPWDSSDGGYTFGKTKKINFEYYPTSSDESKFVYGSILSAVRLAGNFYARNKNIDLGRQSPISISKYDEGKFMGPHTDEMSGAHISGVLYLNDNYFGGELEFPNQGFSIKPEAGSMILFPSTQPYVHDPKPARGAERYICPVFWYN